MGCMGTALTLFCCNMRKNAILDMIANFEADASIFSYENMALCIGGVWQRESVLVAQTGGLMVVFFLKN